MQTKIKRLFWDIETCPNVVLSWRVGHKVSIDHDNIVRERAVICIGYKWEGEKSSSVLTWGHDQNDKPMLQKFLRIINAADEVVHHNGDSFDLPWLMTRCAFHGLQPFPAYKTADTLQWARRRFYFNSNRLDYISGYLGIGRKIKTEFGLWKAVMLDKDKGALKRMADYCAKDVELLEDVWKRLSELVPHKTHAGVAGGGMKWSCAKCASENVKCTKTKITAHGVTQKQMQCNACGGYYSISQAAYDAYKKFMEGDGK